MMGRCLGMGAGFIVFALNAFVGRIGVRRGLFNDGRPHCLLDAAAPWPVP